MKLNNKHKRAVKRRVDLEQGVRPPGSSVFVNKKKYNRKRKISGYYFDGKKLETLYDDRD